MDADSLVVDNFAGGGGASLGMEWALGRPVDIAINHNREALAMHKANHPATHHLCDDVWEVDPVAVCRGKQVAMAWFSPDCKHFSKAKGGKPVSGKIRGLAWVVVRWAQKVRPAVIILENVEEFQEWGPLSQACDRNGRLRYHPDGSPVMLPCQYNKGKTFHSWRRQLERLGYVVDYRELRACDYGSPTIRKRLFVIARCDGRSIVWPAATHGPGLTPYRTAAECIDWTLPCPSIFERKRPLAEATLRRIAKGVIRYVIDAAEPFIVTANHSGDCFRGQGLGVPFRTITAARDAHGLVTAHLARQFGQSVGQPADAPAPTVTAGGMGKTSLVASHLIKLRGTCRDGQVLQQPMPTVTAGGMHLGEVRAFLTKYYGRSTAVRLQAPLSTITTRGRFGLVMVHGEPWQIVDIGMRMLSPRELFTAQGFPPSYIIAPKVDGKPLTATAQVRMCGNSVPPQFAAAVVQANSGEDVFAGCNDGRAA
ncbi:MAG: DNA cytosine methyltransferase [Thermodesulfobacteriota bacterium]